MCNNEECKCISGILKVILNIQRNARQEAAELETCDRTRLGENKIKNVLNTRPIHLFLCCKNGDDPLEMPTNNEPIRPNTKFSNVFRIEKLDDCCATFRVLEEKPGRGEKPDSKIEFESTDSFFTLDLKCVCIIKCLEDTFVEGL